MEGVAGKHRQINLHFLHQKKIRYGAMGDFDGLILGIAVYAAGNQGKGDAFQFLFPGNIQAIAIAGIQKGGFAVAAALPYGPGGMDDIAGGQGIALGDHRMPGGAMADFFTFLFQLFRPGRRKNGAANPAARLQGRICGIDDGVHLHFCNILADDLKGHGTGLLSPALSRPDDCGWGPGGNPPPPPDGPWG